VPSSELLDEQSFALPLEKAARLAGLSQRRLRYWADTGLVAPSIEHSFGPRNTVRLYAFTDLLQLLVATELRGRLPLQHIRRVVDRLQVKGYATPLGQLTFATLGQQIYFQHPDGTWEGDVVPDQIVIHEVINLERLASRVHGAARRPASDVGRTEARRRHLGSKEVFAGTRVPVTTVRGYLERGHTPQEVLAAFPSLREADLELLGPLRGTA